ncbi:putative membrane chloride channel (bestrophin family) [Pseudomonas sp. TE3911]
MIVRPKPNLLGILFSLKGSIAKRIALRSLLVTLLASVIVLVETLHPAYFSKVNATPFTLLGLSLSIFMSFRNNACYDRWWEGRKQLGQMIIEVRSLIRETQVLADAAERARVLRGLGGFAHGLIARLRHENEAQAIQPWASVEADHPNLPDRVLQQLGGRFSVLAQQGVISEWRYTQLENPLGQPESGSGLVRADKDHATALPLHAAFAPHHLPVLYSAALRHGRTSGLADTGVHCHCQLHLFWPG